MGSYAIVTPVRDEEENLRRLAACIEGQTRTPLAWVIVDNGSQDGTVELARRLADREPWIRVCSTPPPGPLERGAPIVRAFHRGLEELPEAPDVVVKLDADTSMRADYFERLVQEFDADAQLGIASGSGQERDALGEWRTRPLAPGSAWGASRAYRWPCLQGVLPLEEAMGWDGIDQLKAELRGWTTRTVLDLPFRHHRAEGERDGARSAAWAAHGRASYYMGYRFSYLVLRSLHHARRQPSALQMIPAFVWSAARRQPQCRDAEVRQHLRAQQRVRALLGRSRQLRQVGT
jgi:poly-beta-1,6-N-acetyl-D-glucosamine synthase